MNDNNVILCMLIADKVLKRQAEIQDIISTTEQNDSDLENLIKAKDYLFKSEMILRMIPMGKAKHVLKK